MLLLSDNYLMTTSRDIGLDKKDLENDHFQEKRLKHLL